jgi:hypothetical protein
MYHTLINYEQYPKTGSTHGTPNSPPNEIFLSGHRDFTVQYQFSCTHHPLYLILHTNYHPRAPHVILLPPPLSSPHLPGAILHSTASSLLCSLRWRPTPPPSFAVAPAPPSDGLDLPQAGRTPSSPSASGPQHGPPPLPFLQPRARGSDVGVSGGVAGDARELHSGARRGRRTR